MRKLLAALICLFALALPSLAQTTFNADDSSLDYQAGHWMVNIINTGSTAYMQMQGGGSELNFRFTGTALSLTAIVGGSSGDFKYSVDGGTFTAVPLQSTVGSVAITSGLTDATHTVVIKHFTGTQSAFQIQLANGISVTGSAPALLAPSSMGTVYNIQNPYIEKAGLQQTTGSGSDLQPSAVTVFDTSTPGFKCFKFRTNATDAYFFEKFGSEFRAYRNTGSGFTSMGTVTSTAGNGSTTPIWGWTAIFTGQTSTDADIWVMYRVNGSTAGSVAQLRLVGGTLKTPTNGRSPYIALVSDSIGQGGNATVKYDGWFMQFCRSRNALMGNFALGGYPVTGLSGSVANMGWKWFSVDHFGSKPDQIIVCIGVNDQMLTNPTTAQFKVGFKRMLRQIAINNPQSIIYVLGILPNSATNFANLSALNTAESDATGELITAGLTNIQTFISTVGWINTTSDMAADPHPNDTGHGKIVTQALSAVPAYTVSSGGTTFIRRAIQ